MSTLYLDLPATIKLGVVIATDCEVVLRKQYIGKVEGFKADLFVSLDTLIQHFSVDRVLSYRPLSIKEKEYSIIVETVCELHKIDYQTMDAQTVCRLIYGTTVGFNFNSEVLKDYNNTSRKKVKRCLALKDADELAHGLRDTSSFEKRG